MTWSAIQSIFEQAESDVLILLDCCASGICNVGDGAGVTDLLAACSYDSEANGVGPYSLTKSLIIEFRAFARARPRFTVAELWQNIYVRTQSHIPQGVRGERYPAPVHITLTRDADFPRQIQLSVLPQPLLPASRGTTVEGPRGSKRAASSSASESRANPKRHRSGLRRTEASGDLARFQDDELDESHLLPNRSESLTMLLAVRFHETAQLSAGGFREWLRSMPALVESVRVEAAFSCDSTLLIVSLPLSLWTSLPDHPAVMPLGPVRSSNLLALDNSAREQQTARRFQPLEDIFKHVPDEIGTLEPPSLDSMSGFLPKFENAVPDTAVSIWGDMDPLTTG